MTWVESFICGIVVDQGHGIRETVARLTLGPVDGLENIGAHDVVRSSPPVRRVHTAAVQVDAKTRCTQFPRTVTLVH